VREMDVVPSLTVSFGQNWRMNVHGVFNMRRWCLEYAVRIMYAAQDAFMC